MIPSVPVLAYHRVGTPDPENLSLSVAAFTAQMGLLARQGWRTLTLGELHRHLSGVEVRRERCLVITFDDGLRDLRFHALPVLRRFHQRATAFVIADRLDRPRGRFRPDLDFNASHALAWQGDDAQFLDRDELRALADTGLIEVHAHGARHEQVFTGRRLTGFYPSDDRHWGVLAAYGGVLPPGEWPVFERGPGLLRPAWRPRLATIAAGVAAGGSQERRRWRAEGVPAAWFATEGAEAFAARRQAELLQARAAVAGLHPPGCSALCWPWGAFDAGADRAAAAAGFDLALRTSAGANLPGRGTLGVHRFPVRRASLLRFLLGIWLRRLPALAGPYGRIHRRI